MAFIFYFVVILVTAASVMFGLDLMTSPLPSTPNVPIGRSAQLATASAGKHVRTVTHEADNRALSPVYPAHPDMPKAKEAKSETTGSAPPSNTPAPPPPQQRASAAPQNPEPQQAASAAPESQHGQHAASTPPQNQQAKLDPGASQPRAEPPASAANGQSPPPVAQSNAHCDVQVCAASYHSFRASDCTYQPYGGARQLCMRTGVAAERPRSNYAARPAPTESRAQASDHDDLASVTRIVRRLTRGDDADRAERDTDGSFIVVRPGRDRGYARFDDDDDGD